MTNPELLSLAPEQSTAGERADLLDQSGWAKALSWDQIQAIAEGLKLFQIPEGFTLIAEAAKTSFLAIVVDGLLVVKKEGGAGEQAIITRMGKGKAVGEISFFDNFPASATVAAEQKTQLLVLSQTRFNQLSEQNPAVANIILQLLGCILAARLRQTSGKLVEYSVGEPQST